MLPPPASIAGLLDDAYDVLFRDNHGVNYAEHIFERVLNVLKRDDEARQWFLRRAVEEILTGGEALPSPKPMRRPPEFLDDDLLNFVAHATKWKELAEACRRRMLSIDYLRKLAGSREIADDVMNALSDDWEDRDFYRLFSEE